MLHFTINESRAQYPAFSSYSTEAGLPQSQVLAIHQDQRGYLWLGTQGGGITRFDGYSFWTPNSSLDEQPFNVVNDIAEDSQGTLWIATENGLFFYDGFELAKYNQVQNLPSAYINDLHFDRNGVLWIGTGKGLYAKDFSILSDTLAQHILLDTPVRALHETDDGILWIGTTSGVYTSHNNEITAFEQLAGIRANDITVDNSDTVWIASSSGVWSVSNEEITHFTPQSGLPTVRTEVVYVDQNNTVWAGTLNGIAQLNAGKFERYNTGAFDDDRVMSIFQDREGNFWFGIGGKGIFLDSQTAFTYLTQDQGLPDNIVWNIEEIAPNQFLVGTKQGLALLDMPAMTAAHYPEVFADKSINDIHVDKNNKTWIATNTGLYHKTRNGFSPVTDLPGLPSVVLRIDETDDTLWLSTFSGVIRIADSEVEFIDLKQIGGTPYGVVQDKFGDHWIANSNGILRLEENKQTKYSTEDGLTHKSVIDIAMDSDGDLWLATYRGLTLIKFSDNKDIEISQIRQASNREKLQAIWFSTIDKNDNLWFCDHNKLSLLDISDFKTNQRVHVKMFDRIDGYNEKECTRASLTIDQSDNLWFGTVDGLVKYTPTLESAPIPILRASIDKIEIDHQEVKRPGSPDSTKQWTSLPSTLSVGYQDGPITFHFKETHFKSKDNVRYRYKLLGENTQITRSLLQSSVSFERLWPGTYTLHAEAALRRGEYLSEADTYTFTIKPAYWQTWWFYLGSVILGISSVAAITRWRTGHIKQRQEELERVVSERTAELKASNLALKEARIEAEDAVKYKSVMLANMSHEIRTPMNGIIGATDLLLGETNDPIIQDYLTMIQSSGESLLTILNDILSYSKIEAGKVQLEFREIDIRELIEDIATLFSPKAHQRKLEIYSICSHEIPPSLIGDPVRLKQILSNLTGNAIKFTEAGEVRIEAHLMSNNSENCYIRFEVHDTGIGIPENRLKAVFNSFEQADSSTTRKYGGTGLGLAISKELCQLMDGEIGVESKYGKGSTFWFYVKLQLTPGMVAPQLYKQFTDLPVLVVNESPTSHRLFRELLHDFPSPFTTERSLTKASALLCSNEGAVYKDGILIIDGTLFQDSEENIALLRAIKISCPNLQTIITETSVSLLSSKNIPESEINYRIRKPIRFTQLREIFLLEKKRRVSHLRHETSPAPRLTKHLPDRVYLMSNNALELKIASRLLTRAGIQLESEHIKRTEFKLSPSTQPDNIILDLTLPLDTATLLIASIREHMNTDQQLKSVPLIGAVSTKEQAEIDLLLKAGLDEVIQKPIKVAKLAISHQA